MKPRGDKIKRSDGVVDDPFLPIRQKDYPFQDNERPFEYETRFPFLGIEFRIGKIWTLLIYNPENHTSAF